MFWTLLTVYVNKQNYSGELHLPADIGLYLYLQTDDVVTFHEHKCQYKKEKIKKIQHLKCLFFRFQK